MSKFYLYITSLLVILMTHTKASAQFNDSIHYRVNVSSTGTFNRTNDGSNYLLNNSVGFNVKKQRLVLNSANTWIYGNNANDLTNNDFTSTLDLNLFKSLPHFYYWGLVNFTTSYSLKIKDQVQSGLGVAYRIIDKPNTVLSISDGFLLEKSDITQQDQKNLNYQTVRNSFRVQYRYKYKELITFTGQGFYQPSLNYGGDFIITTNASLGIKIWKWLSFTTTASYNKISRTNRENLVFTYGLVAERFF